MTPRDLAVLCADVHFVRYPVAAQLAMHMRAKERRARMACMPEPKKALPVYDRLSEQFAAAHALLASLKAEAGPLTIRRIQHVVADHYGVTVLDIISARRTADVIMPRHVAIYLARELTRKSLPEIGRRFGHRDHTTALSAIEKIKKKIQNDGDLASTIVELKARLSPAGGPQ